MTTTGRRLRRVFAPPLALFFTKKRRIFDEEAALF
jgi:hypothetical protein